MSSVGSAAGAAPSPAAATASSSSAVVAAAAAGASAGSVFVSAPVTRASFARVPILVGDAVTDLAKRASLELDWRASAAHVSLFLVRADLAEAVESGDESAGVAAKRLFSGADLTTRASQTAPFCSHACRPRPQPRLVRQRRSASRRHRRLCSTAPSPTRAASRASSFSTPSAGRASAAPRLEAGRRSSASSASRRLCTPRLSRRRWCAWRPTRGPTPAPAQLSRRAAPARTGARARRRARRGTLGGALGILAGAALAPRQQTRCARRSGRTRRPFSWSAMCGHAEQNELTRCETGLL